MKKLPILIAGVAGYVLGARAGRQRYEQIKDQSAKVWNSPTVQHGVDEATEKAKAAADAAASKVAETVREHAPFGSDDSPAGPTTPASPAPAPTKTAPTNAAPGGAPTTNAGPPAGAGPSKPVDGDDPLSGAPR